MTPLDLLPAFGMFFIALTISAFKKREAMLSITIILIMLISISQIYAS